MQIEIIAYRLGEAYTAPDGAHTPARWVEVQNVCIENFHPLTPREAFDYVTDLAADRLLIKQGGKTERWQWDGDGWKEGWNG